MARTILFVDDDRSLCKLLSKAFSVEGYRVVRAHDGQEALERFGGRNAPAAASQLRRLRESLRSRH